jgi:hypothetical protein
MDQGAIRSRARTPAWYRTRGYLPNLVVQNVLYTPLKFRLRLPLPAGAANTYGEAVKLLLQFMDCDRA